MKRGSLWLTQGAEVLALREEQAADGQPPEFDVVVVGSGYGGAVAAARLSAMVDGQGRRMRVCVLERGLEYLPGDFPTTFEQAVAHVRYSGTKKAEVRGVPEGLFDFRLGQDVSALVANGFGGGSLINAGVAEAADPVTLNDAAWPPPWRGDGVLWGCLYERARVALRAQRWPDRPGDKQGAMWRLADRLDARSTPVALTIQTPEQDAPPGPDGAPAAQHCIECGDCFSGCNENAKLTLSHGYLARASRNGAELYTGATVMRIASRGKAGWQLHYRLTDPKRLPGRTRLFKVNTRRVVVAAGSFGSTELLMRSSSAKLRFSARLGEGFSANADAIGAQYGTLGASAPFARESQPRAQRKVGPTITHQIDLRHDGQAPADQRFVVQDLTVPAPLHWIFNELLTSLAVPQRWQKLDWRCRGPDSPDPFIVDDAPGSPLARTVLVAMIGHDGAGGRLQPLPGFKASPQDGTLTVDWPQIGALPAFRHADARLMAATEAGAYWLRNPLWKATPDSPLLEEPRRRAVATVHPLGGCGMAESMLDGVVSPLAQVFDAGAATGLGAPGSLGAEWTGIETARVHPGLFVLDGSIVPTSLGINPLLTITALAEGIVDGWRDFFGWRELDTANAAQHALPLRPPAAPPPALPGKPTSLRFRERMTGLIDPALAPVQPAADPGAGWPQTPAVFSQHGDDRWWPRIAIHFEFGEPDGHGRRIPDVEAFLGQRRKALAFDATIELMRTSWDPTRQRKHQREEGATHCSLGPIHGEAVWFEHAPSTMLGRIWRSYVGWQVNRAAADLQPARRWLDTLRLVPPFLKALSHFGGPRKLVYRFYAPGSDAQARGLPAPLELKAPDGSVIFRLDAGDLLTGEKTFVYESGANPWLQLTRMPLVRTRADGSAEVLTTLHYDPLFELDRYTLPLSLQGQADGVHGLRDAARLALYFGRVVLGSHFLSFRAPDYAVPRPLQRLPAQPRSGKYAGCSFEVHAVEIQRVGAEQRARLRRAGPAGAPAQAYGRQRQVEPLRLRLTHIALGAGAPAEPGHARADLPVLLLHGFGSGGVQFTHEAIPTPMAAYLARRGFDVWVGELRTSIGLPSCKQQWVMDDIALEDVPALVSAVCERSGHQQIDVIAHCIGSAMFCMAALDGQLTGPAGPAGPARSRIRRAALMQVGPVIHLPPENRVRGYLGNRAQVMVDIDKVEATVDDRASDSEIAFDRLLGNLPLLGGWTAGAWRERRTVLPPLSASRAANARRTNILRSAAVFGQLFQQDKMADPALLDALPDLLGPCNLTTYQQTVYYAFTRQLTNQSGETAYVTYQHLRDNFDFETLFLQGELNDVFDQRGTYDSVRLLQRANPQARVGRVLLRGYGHLDAVVGVDAATEVYPHLDRFLRHGIQDEWRLPAGGHSGFRALAVGPWLGDAWSDGNGGMQLAIGLKVDDLLPPPVHVMTQILVDGVDTDDPAEQPAIRHLVARRDQTRDAWDSGEAVIEIGLSRQQLDRVQDRLEVWIATLDAPQVPPPLADLRADWLPWRKRRGAGDDAAAHPRPIVLTRRWIDARRRAAAPLRFVVGRCRPTPLLIARPLADAAFAAIGQRLAEEPPLSHLLLLGDQVYADALAATGQVQGTRARFFDVHREAWSARQQREVMRRVPVYMAADDHEFRDDYNDEIARRHPVAAQASRAAVWCYQHAAGPAGRRAYRRLASVAALHPLGHGIDPEAAARRWYAFTAGGYEFFVCDTRDDRHDTPTIGRDAATIMSDTQFIALRAWLKHTRRAGAAGRRPRFVAMGSPPFPSFAAAAGDPAYALRSDSWQRFPQSLARLLALVLDDATGNLVFLAGDYHCYTDGQIRIGDGGHATTARCITTSGLFAPYSFANAAPEELLATEQGVAGTVPWRYDMRRRATGSGYVMLTADVDGALNPEFVPLA